MLNFNNQNYVRVEIDFTMIEKQYAYHIYTESFSLRTVQSSNKMFALKKSFDRTWSIVQKVSYTISGKLVIGPHTAPHFFFFFFFFLFIYIYIYIFIYLYFNFMNKKALRARMIIDSNYLNPYWWRGVTSGHVKAIGVMTQYFYEAYNLNLTTLELINVINKINKLFILLITNIFIIFNMLYVVELSPL